MKKSKSKTIQKGDEPSELFEWIHKNIEYDLFQPDGIEWSGGEPGPYDPILESKFKYTITITKHDAC